MTDDARRVFTRDETLHEPCRSARRVGSRPCGRNPSEVTSVGRRASRVRPCLHSTLHESAVRGKRRAGGPQFSE